MGWTGLDKVPAGGWRDYFDDYDGELRLVPPRLAPPTVKWVDDDIPF